MASARGETAFAVRGKGQNPPDLVGRGLGMLAEFFQRLRSLLPRFGKNAAAFAISPAFWWIVTDNGQLTFRELSQASEIPLLASKAELQDWVSVEKQPAQI